MSEEFTHNEIPPQWLDQTFFERAIRSFERNDRVQVKDFKITPGAKPGEHIGSVMFKVKITYLKPDSGEQTIYTVLKMMPVHEGIKLEYLKSTSAFASEAHMYAKVIPAMEEVMRRAGDSTTFGPKLIYQNCKTEPAEVILLEDLTTRGYQKMSETINKLENILAFVKKVAKFHALSIYLDQNGLPLVQFTDHNICKIMDENSMTYQISSPVYANLIEQMKSWGGFEKYSAYLSEHFDAIRNCAIKVAKSPRKFSVLNHGDLHNRNILHMNDGGKEEDWILIDYQFPFWGTPALDWFNIVNMTCNDSLAKEHRESILAVYYKTFTSTLVRINYSGEIPSMLELKVALLEGAYFDFLGRFLVVPIRIFDFSEKYDDKSAEEAAAVDEEALQELSNSVFGIPEYRQYVLEVLKAAEEAGVIAF